MFGRLIFFGYCVILYLNKLGDYIMLRKFTIEDGQEPTEAQLAEVKAAAKRPVQFDEDAPELSPALYKAFECAARQRNRRNKNT